MAFDFKRHLIKVQGGRQYLPVSARLIWFRSEHPDWGIETEAIEINHEKQYAIFRARIFNQDNKLMAMGTKKEDVKGFGDYVEKAETGAVGRALALCGYGTQFSPELDEASHGRYSDSPQPMGGNRFGSGNGGYSSRYGNDGSSGDGGTRFTPPREVSAPMQSEAPPRAAAPREESPVRPAPDTSPRRPAPVPAATDDEDEFEALLGGTEARDASEDDPFGEEQAPRAAAVMAPKAAPAAVASATPACVGCGKALTKAQQDLSIRNYGEALCPGCQKDRGRSDRPAVAAR